MTVEFPNGNVLNCIPEGFPVRMVDFYNYPLGQFNQWGLGGLYSPPGPTTDFTGSNEMGSLQYPFKPKWFELFGTTADRDWDSDFQKEIRKQRIRCERQIKRDRLRTKKRRWQLIDEWIKGTLGTIGFVLFWILFNIPWENM